jgi:pimeloyl-ACP methyl ester carboxylesterase
MVDRFVELATTPLAPGARDIRIHLRESGSGQPLVFLHGGWGYAIYPFERQVAALEREFRILIPDRTGYGRSSRLDQQPRGFHHRAAEETFAVLDALGVGRAALWGHSDGAVIALHMALMSPQRVAAIVAEATHFYRKKPRSRAFFETMRDAADDLGPRVASTLEQEHGPEWRHLIRINGDAWLRIADEATSGTADLYDGLLPELAVPVLFVHGAQDPRSEPGEFDAMAAAPRRRALVQIARFEEGGHSPHSERSTAEDVTAAAARFLSRVMLPPAVTQGAE